MLLAHETIIFSAADIAMALGVARQVSERRAAKESWYVEREGKAKRYYLMFLPKDVQFALMRTFPGKCGAKPEPEEEPSYNPELLWEAYTSKKNTAKERAGRRFDLVVKVADLVADGLKVRPAVKQVVAETGEAESSLLRWYYQVQPFRRQDWLAVLVDNQKGGLGRGAYIHPEAWDWFLTSFLDRKQPAVESCYRRLQEAASTKGWPIPSLGSLKRRIKIEISPQTAIYHREGEKALQKLYPKQVRDKTCFAAGEAVSGDGVKFDRLWVRFEDGEVLNTATAWVWQDIYSGKIMASRVGKTENTDLFRLSLWDLVATCVPSFAWVDNTRVAANKAMTGRSFGRRRFKNRPNDPMGIMSKLGMQVRFTDPDQTISNPGVKPIERAFGRGGIHEMVATSPRLKGRGHSQATAIPVEELRQVLAEEIVRFNARRGRRGGVCNGRSYDQVFAESFKGAVVHKITEAQRSMLLLMPEVVRAHRTDGSVALNAGRGPNGRNRYWNEALPRFAGQEVVVYFDPENLSQDVRVETLDGAPICAAQWLPSVAFNDTETGREHAKNKRRHLKALKDAAKAQKRMTDLEMQQLYPAAEPPAAPPPGVISLKFGSGKGEACKPPMDAQDVRRKVGNMDDLILNVLMPEFDRQQAEKALPTRPASRIGSM